MEQARARCMICGKPAVTVKGGICEPCQERIRKEALGEQAEAAKRADSELAGHGVNPSKTGR
ncbi:MAG TPA: hypothetical protein VNN77_03585 [candidate division Zixibacteria bacterium]|nr:hypothetical protein [candidate division Zixibacteria bacterium]